MQRAVGFGLAATPVDLRRAACPPAASRRLLRLVAGRERPRLPDLDDVRRGAGPTCRPAAGRRVDTALASTSYDPSIQAAATKTGCLAGMGMTEKQGGSDVRANVTTANALGPDGEYVLNGHKWFTSAPMNDVFLVLAQAAGGLTCFVVPRVLPDGSRNPFAIQRLKDKLGNRSNASAEIEFDDTWAMRLGRRGPWHRHHHRDGRRDSSRLRTRLGRPDAEFCRRGRLAYLSSSSLRTTAD